MWCRYAQYAYVLAHFFVEPHADNKRSIHPAGNRENGFSLCQRSDGDVSCFLCTADLFFQFPQQRDLFRDEFIVLSMAGIAEHTRDGLEIGQHSRN